MEQRVGTGVSRRRFLQFGVAASAGAALTGIEAMARVPERAQGAPMPRELPDIQFAIGPYLAPPVEIDGTKFGFGPVYTMFLTFTLRRAPRKEEQRAFERMLQKIEERYPFRADGVFTHTGERTSCIGPLHVRSSPSTRYSRWS